MNDRRTRPSRFKSADDLSEEKLSPPPAPVNSQQSSGRTRRKSDRHNVTTSQNSIPKKQKKEKKLAKPEGMPSLLLTDVIKAGEQLTSPSVPQDGSQNTDVYRIMDILLRGCGMDSPFVAVAIQFVEQLVKTKNIPPLDLMEKRKFLTSTMALTQKSIANIDRIISAIKIQKCVRGFLLRQKFRRLRALYSSVDWFERNNTYLYWLSDEEDYGRKLKTIIDDYKIPLELKKDIIQPLDIEKIFSIIDKLLETQKSIIVLLRKVLPTHPHIIGLGDKWCEVAQYLKNYGPYVENSAHALTTLHRLLTTNSKFKLFITSINPIESTLGHLLQLPITRIAKYQEFLKSMLKNTPSRHIDFDALSKAHEVMKIANEYVEKNLAAAKNRDNILEVVRRLQNCDTPLYVEGRTFVGEATVTVIIKGKRAHRKFILFSDVALFAKQTKKDLLEFKNLITFNASSEVTDRLAGDSTLKNKKKQENPIMITNCETQVPGPVILLFKTEEHELWLKYIQAQVGALKRASCVVFGAPVMEMIKKCITNGQEINTLTIDENFDTDTLVPPFLQTLFTQLDKNLTEKGIYRVSGLEADIKELRSLLDKVKPSTNITHFSPHVIADVLKLYFRELPEPLLTYEFYDKVISELHKKKDSDNDEYPIMLSDMLKQLPLPNYSITKALVRHLYKVEKFSSYNLMGSTNLAIVFGPTLLSPKNESIEHTLMMPRVYAVIQCLIERYDTVFQDSIPTLPELRRSQINFPMSFNRDERATSGMLALSEESREEEISNLPSNGGRYEEGGVGGGHLLLPLYDEEYTDLLSPPFIPSCTSSDMTESSITEPPTPSSPNPTPPLPSIPGRSRPPIRSGVSVSNFRREGPVPPLKQSHSHDDVRCSPRSTQSAQYLSSLPSPMSRSISSGSDVPTKKEKGQEEDLK